MKASTGLRFDHVAVPVHDAQSALCARRGAKKQTQPAVDLPHYALTTHGLAELKAWEKKLVAAGFSIRHEDHGDQRSIYFDDRNGLTWEITTARAGLERDPDARSIVESWIAAGQRKRAR